MEWLNYIIPVVSIGLSYILGRFENRHSRKLEAHKERYETFYKEYLRLLMVSAPFKDNYSDGGLEGRAKYFDLVFNNFHLIDPDTAEHCSDYYYAFLDMLEYDDGNPNFSKAPEIYNSIFIKISKSVIVESSKLAKSLKLPDISRVVAKANDLE